MAGRGVRKARGSRVEIACFGVRGLQPDKGARSYDGESSRSEGVPVPTEGKKERGPGEGAARERRPAAVQKLPVTPNV